MKYYPDTALPPAKALKLDLVPEYCVFRAMTVVSISSPLR